MLVRVLYWEHVRPQANRQRINNMSALGFLLARDMSGEWNVLDKGSPTEVRQKFKHRSTVDNDGMTELFYADTRGRVSRKAWRKRLTQSEPEPVSNDSYTGEDEPKPVTKKVSRRRGRG